MELNAYLFQGNLVRFETVRPMQKVLVVRNARDGHVRAYVGVVNQLRKPNAYVVDLQASEFFEDSIKSTKFKEKEVSFRNASEIAVYLLENTTQDVKKKLAEERRSYAKARRALQQARSAEVESFTILGLTSDCTLEQFKIVRKRMMISWHPDKWGSHPDMSREEFEKQSKKVTDAISWVSQYLETKLNRVK